ncbi:germinal-center associated nuclear protein [Agrilus planipennis]|uniref:Germinal-center associated nuclear protein n=1 Tax=Agrilus planipennis TaxID=224129 RepID=A0A1W4X5Y9_AGRPL|nr:germinal-center associated nuclear protein [Agrilus planipennis]
MEDEHITGICLGMCPEEEIKLRQREGLLHRLEVFNPERNTNKSNYCAVKQFSRSAAGQNMQNVKLLRPGPVLMHTVKYLLDEVINSKECPWHVVYAFITDRLRAVRQDMIIQRISRSYCVAILQPIIGFHAYAAYRLCNEPVPNFDPVLNKQHLNECLKMLLSLYDEFEMFEEQYPNELLAKVKWGSDIQSYNYDVNFEKTRPFMEALYLVLNLGHSDPILRGLILPKKFK